MALDIMTDMTLQEILEKVQLQNAYLAAIAGADPGTVTVTGLFVPGWIKLLKRHTAGYGISYTWDKLHWKMGEKFLGCICRRIISHRSLFNLTMKKMRGLQSLHFLETIPTTRKIRMAHISWKRWK